jgi:hypothetical protein
MKRRLMSEYRDLYRGLPAAVLGGGPSLPGDFERLTRSPSGAPPARGAELGAPCILIAVNYHAFRLAGCRPDFMVYNDQPDSDQRLDEAVRFTRGRGGAVRVSPDPSSDIKFDVAVWTGSYSSNTAAWFALWMGCDPVILCGMDCYQGERVYFHEYNHDSPAFHYPLNDQLRPWIEDGRNLLPHVERLRAMSGPLVGVFPAYEVR